MPRSGLTDEAQESSRRLLHRQGSFRQQLHDLVDELDTLRWVSDPLKSKRSDLLDVLRQDVSLVSGINTIHGWLHVGDHGEALAQLCGDE